MGQTTEHQSDASFYSSHKKVQKQKISIERRTLDRVPSNKATQFSLLSGSELRWEKVSRLQCDLAALPLWTHTHTQKSNRATTAYNQHVVEDSR